MFPFALLSLACLAFAVPSAGKDESVTRGYLDEAYSLDSLDGRPLQLQGISRSNAKLERTLEVAAYDEGALPMDSLYGLFNARLQQTLRKKLGKSRLHLADTARKAGGTVLRRLIGDPVMPDSFVIEIPAPAPSVEGGVSLVVGKAVFGVRSQQVLRYRAPNRFVPPNQPFAPKLPNFPRYKQRFYLEDSDPLDQPEPEDPYFTKDKKKKFYTIVEFCFYDHRANRSFGYGWEVAETDFRGEFAKFLMGRSVNLDRHMRELADNLAGLFLRRGSRVENYRNTEIAIVEQRAPPPEIIREELEEDGEE